MIGRWNVIDPFVEKHYDITPYNYVMNNPMGYIDPFGLDTLNANKFKAQDWHNFNTSKDVMALSEVTVTASKSSSNSSSSAGGLWGYFTSGEKHFNGGLGLAGAAVSGYNKIPNDVKRHYAYKLSKTTGIKSGKLFQGAKGGVKWAGKLVKRLGPVGTIATGGSIVYEAGSGTWDAHTIVNGGLLLGTAAATIFAAPVVLGGIAAYGVADYVFNISETIDSHIGRNSDMWKDDE